jgi:hypothetical protein
MPPLFFCRKLPSFSRETIVDANSLLSHGNSHANRLACRKLRLGNGHGQTHPRAIGSGNAVKEQSKFKVTLACIADEKTGHGKPQG